MPPSPATAFALPPEPTAMRSPGPGGATPGGLSPIRRRGVQGSVALAAVLAGLVAVHAGGCTPADRETGTAEVVRVGAGPAPAPVAPAAALADDDAMAARYLELRGSLDRDELFAPAGAAERGAVERDLQTIANRAKDLHLRANAAMLLGAIAERSGALDRAVANFRLARGLVPDDAGPALALAAALARTAAYAEAATVQLEAATLDPDNLEAWLALGELRVKAGDRTGATEAYAAYELRRKGLIDGLTLKHAGEYVQPPEQRAGCAVALAAAADDGTALALLYALRTEPDPNVRLAIVETMGEQRLAGYLAPLTAVRATEPATEVRVALDGAIAAIQRDPVDTKAVPAPALPPGALDAAPPAPANAPGAGPAIADGAPAGAPAPTPAG